MWTTIISAIIAVVGIVTGRDVRFESRLDVPVRDIMPPRARLVTVPEGIALTQREAMLKLKKYCEKYRIRYIKRVIVADNSV